jgi:hypothetical protein
MSKFPKWTAFIKKSIPGIAILLVALPAVGAGFVRAFPAASALGAERLRELAGDQVVAQVEDMLFQIQDGAADLEYRLGVLQVNSPWQGTAGANPPASAPAQALAGSSRADAGEQRAMPTPAPIQSHPAQHPSPTVPDPPAPAAPSATPGWTLQPVTPIGSLAGEGAWSAYIQDPSGQLVAERTFLQADPQRPYALVAVVAFDLQAIRLHFIIGTAEPYALPSPPARASGAIPSSDLVPGTLLAAFNGGFKYAQGRFGAMADGMVSAPPQDGLATLAIGTDGKVQMGAWGQDISPEGAYQAWRQNGPLAIHNGLISTKVGEPRHWGFTVRGAAATWRSGLGISRDGNTLYYFAGPYTTIDVLTRAMAQVGVWNAMQLDINDYWVHFDRFTVQAGSLSPDELFPLQKAVDDKRFLKPYSRDFFYVTTR